MKIPLWMLFLGFCAFVALSSGLGLVYISSHTQHDLVREDYYQAGLHLDQQKLREAEFDSLNIQLNLTEKNSSLVVETQEEGSPDPALVTRLHSYTVKLFLQRPDDPSADRILALQIASNDIASNSLRWSVATPRLRKGRWNCRIVFEDQGQPKIENSFIYNTTL